jgi:hypothetical protein
MTPTGPGFSLKISTRKGGVNRGSATVPRSTVSNVVQREHILTTEEGK